MFPGSHTIPGSKQLWGTPKLWEPQGGQASSPFLELHAVCCHPPPRHGQYLLLVSASLGAWLCLWERPPVHERVQGRWVYIWAGARGVFAELLPSLPQRLQMTFQELNYDVSVLAESRNRLFDYICWKSLPQPAPFSAPVSLLSGEGTERCGGGFCPKSTSLFPQVVDCPDSPGLPLLTQESPGPCDHVQDHRSPSPQHGVTCQQPLALVFPLILAKLWVPQTWGIKSL